MTASDLAVAVRRDGRDGAESGDRKEMDQDRADNSPRGDNDRLQDGEDPNGDRKEEEEAPATCVANIMLYDRKDLVRLLLDVRTNAVLILKALHHLGGG